ncbi:MAG: DUF3575 domain-containing protein [Muribaculaceae bacterium]|nr:DUF3575 domain-containing protein [Muribaculaceae bacterium]
MPSLRRFQLSVLAILVVFLPSQARQVTDSVKIHFRQAVDRIEPWPGDNFAKLDSLRAEMRAHCGMLRVVGAASPEGGVAYNRGLSTRRALAVTRYLGIPDSIADYTFLGRDWRGLREQVLADSAVPYRDDVLALLDEVTADYTTTEPDHSGYLRRLRALHGGVPYGYLYRREFPDLRATHVYLQWPLVVPFEAPQPPVEWPVVMAGRPSAPAHVALPVEKARKPVYWALKTNLLYDALALPTVGAEVYLGRGWSLSGDWTYGWWDNDHSHRYWRAYGGNLGVRRWLGSRAAAKPLTGHHVGAFAGVITYDFEFGGEGVMGGLPHRTLWDRCNFVCGLEYGYSAPIARRLNLDFVIGVGYIGGKYLKYRPYGNGYEWMSTHRLHWFGPVKAEVSLVWLLGRDNYNTKGGRR